MVERLMIRLACHRSTKVWQTDRQTDKRTDRENVRSISSAVVPCWEHLL